MRHNSPPTDHQLQAAGGALDALARALHSTARTFGPDRLGATVPLDAAGVLAASAAAQATMQAATGASHPDTARGLDAGARLTLVALDPMADDHRDAADRHARAAARLTARSVKELAARRLHDVPDLIAAARRELAAADKAAGPAQAVTA